MPVHIFSLRPGSPTRRFRRLPQPRRSASRAARDKSSSLRRAAATARKSTNPPRTVIRPTSIRAPHRTKTSTRSGA
jgi:hypothetical protein